MFDIQTPVSQWTDADIEGMYNKLLATANEKREAKVASKWSPSEFQIASGFAVRVAQNSTLPEFKQFIRTGVPVNPVKMTPGEMELLQGGFSFHLPFHLPHLTSKNINTAANVVGSVATAAAAFCA
jgi:hypothetical protein